MRIEITLFLRGIMILGHGERTARNTRATALSLFTLIRHLQCLIFILVKIIILVFIGQNPQNSASLLSSSSYKPISLQSSFSHSIHCISSNRVDRVLYITTTPPNLALMVIFFVCFYDRLCFAFFFIFRKQRTAQKGSTIKHIRYLWVTTKYYLSCKDIIKR